MAGFLLRTGTAEARLIGLGAAGLTTAVGAALLVTGGFYVPGTIIAIIALFQLVGAPGEAVHPGAGPTPAHLQAHLPAQLPPWSPGQGAPSRRRSRRRVAAAAAPAPQQPAGQEWDYFGKPT